MDLWYLSPEFFIKLSMYNITKDYSVIYNSHSYVSDPVSWLTHFRVCFMNLKLKDSVQINLSFYNDAMILLLTYSDFYFLWLVWVERQLNQITKQLWELFLQLLLTRNTGFHDFHFGCFYQWVVFLGDKR